MPNYEYKCTQDGSRFELWQEVGAEAPPCPTCGAPSKKVFQPPRVIFKGSGFYLTDLRAEKSGASAEKSGDSGVENSKDTPKTDSKTETKADVPAASTKDATSSSGASPNGATPKPG